MKSDNITVAGCFYENFGDYIFFYIQLVKQNTTIYTMPALKEIYYMEQ